METQTGYSLIDKKNKEIQSWYNNFGSRNIPDEIFLPNGDIVCAPCVYETFSGEYKLVKRKLINNKPGEWFAEISSSVEFDGTDIVETYFYPNKPNVCPVSVSPYQFRKALNQLNIRKQIDDYVATLDQDAQDAWEYALDIERGNPLISAAQIALNYTDEQVDDIFRLASTL